MCVKTVNTMNKLFYYCARLKTNNKFQRISSLRHFSIMPAQCTFKGVIDQYKGVTVEFAKEKCDQDKFMKLLQESLDKWTTDGNRCIWFKIHVKDAYCVPILAQKGFTFHHARDDFVMMYKWLPKDSKPNIPPSSHTNLGVGAIVFNNKNQILAISEKNYNYPHWKLPGGYVEQGEDIISAAIREVREETGVEAKFESLVTMRHTHNMMFGNSDIYAILMLTALTNEIKILDREINQCQWMDIEEYCNHPHVHKFNRFVVERALEYKSLNLKLDIEKKILKFATNLRDINYFVIKPYDSS